MKHTRFQFSFVLSPLLVQSDKAYSDEEMRGLIDFKKGQVGCKIGRLIADNTGFTEQEDLHSFNNKRYLLDIIAFQSDRWGQFKKELRDFLINTLMKDSDLEKVKELFNKLEDPGK